MSITPPAVGAGGPGYAQVANEIMGKTRWFDIVEDFGAHSAAGDSQPEIQDGLNDVPSTGAVVATPPDAFSVANSLIPADLTHLTGAGFMGIKDGQAVPNGSVYKWTGATGGKVFDLTTKQYVTFDGVGVDGDGIADVVGWYLAGRRVGSTVYACRDNGIEDFAASNLDTAIQIGSGYLAAVGTGSMTSGSAVLTVSAPLFSASDVGKFILVLGAAGSGNTLASRINSYTSPTSVTLANNAAATVSGKDVIAWDDSQQDGTKITRGFVNDCTRVLRISGGNAQLTTVRGVRTRNNRTFARLEVFSDAVFDDCDYAGVSGTDTFIEIAPQAFHNRLLIRGCHTEGTGYFMRVLAPGYNNSEPIVIENCNIAMPIDIQVPRRIIGIGNEISAPITLCAGATWESIGDQISSGGSFGGAGVHMESGGRIETVITGWTFSLADGAATSTTVPVTGARAGDVAVAHFDEIGASSPMFVSAMVKNDDQVIVSILNKRGGAFNPDVNSKLYVTVFKHGLSAGGGLLV